MEKKKELQQIPLETRVVLKDSLLKMEKGQEGFFDTTTVKAYNVRSVIRNINDERKKKVFMATTVGFTDRIKVKRLLK